MSKPAESLVKFRTPTLPACGLVWSGVPAGRIRSFTRIGRPNVPTLTEIGVDFDIDLQPNTGIWTLAGTGVSGGTRPCAVSFSGACPELCERPGMR